MATGFVLRAQTARFEAADIQSSDSSIRSVRSLLLRNGRYELRHATLIDLVGTAYDVDPDRVTGGPTWLASRRFDVVAKAPAMSTVKDVKAMLRTLLSERFSLQVHDSQMPMRAYALRVDKKPQMTRATGAGEGGCRFDTAVGPHGVFSQIAKCQNSTMAVFAEWLSTIPAAKDYLGGLPVTDETGLTGSWNFTFTWFSQRAIAIGGAENITLFDAVGKLGLRLEAATVSRPVIVIDRVNDAPTENPPDTVEVLGRSPLPSEFEVADVRVSDPASTAHMTQQVSPDGRVTIRNTTLKFLIKRIWNIQGDELIAGSPSWLDDDRFDIVAKAPSADALSGPAYEWETIVPLLRSLLGDRFRLQTHVEQRTMPAYSLAAAKPKLAKADTAARSECRRAVGAGRGELTDAIVCRNMTMASFAGQLQGLASAYIHSPVLDASGIVGSWDFTVRFSGPLFAAHGSGLTLSDALQGQLGLKLVEQKRPVAVLVIDHVERKPVDN
jgi:uncharacterized protein (TIGR03435 family)